MCPWNSPSDAKPTILEARGFHRLSFDLERGRDPARQGVEHPPVLPAELGRALAPGCDARPGRLRVLAAWDRPSEQATVGPNPASDNRPAEPRVGRELGQISRSSC